MGITKTQKALAGFSALKKQENGREVIEQILNMGQPRFAGALRAEFEEHIEYGNPPELDFDETDSFTIECWAKLYEGQDRFSIIQKGSTQHSFGISAIGDFLRIGIRGEGSNDLRSEPPFFFGEWFHVAMTFTPEFLISYLNGDLIDSFSDPLSEITGTFSNSNIWQSLGNLGLLGSGGDVDGEICQVRFWNRALSGSEIRANMYRRLKGDEEGLVGYYPLDSLDVTDLTENGNDGSLTGNVSLVQPFNPLFTGDDRPELHQEKIAVEREVENLVLGSEDFSSATSGSTTSSPWGSGGSTPIFEANEINPKGELGSWRLTGTGAGGRIQQIGGQGFPLLDGTYTVSFWVRSENLSENEFRFILESGDIRLDYDITQEWKRIVFTETFDPSNKLEGIRFQGGDYYLFGIQLEEGSYPSLYIKTEDSPVTRPEPKVLFPDTLSEQGHIHIKCDTINADQILFANESNALAIDDNYLSGKLLGNPFGSLPIGTDADLYDRIQFQVILTWNEEGGNVFFKVDGQVTQFPLSIQQIEDLDPNIFLGANADGEGQKSCYFDILRTGEQRLTLQEAKNLMEL